MRRRISLYINGQLADLADDGFVLLNVLLSDLTNPAVVRNSWTQEVELPRCPANDRIFGHSGRLDRLAGAGGSGPDFNASKRTPFTIYAETGEVLFSGYAKLNGVTRDAYRVSLYGGLGDFLYGLAYDGAGNKRSLADLDYGVDLDFTITLQTVRDAWARLAGDTSKPEKWDVINFAPCYNGVPSDFSADKAVAAPGDVGLTVPSGYNTKSGLTLITLSGEKDEWEVRDLRSYLQRPVLSVRKLLAAIASPYNNGGWSVDLSDLAALPQLDTWLTRPLLPSLGTYKQTSGAMAAAFENWGAKTASPVGQISLSGTIPAGTGIKVNASFGLSYQCPGVPNATLYANDNLAARTEQVLFVQAVAYASDNTKVAASKTKVILPNNELTPEVVAAWCVYTPDPMNTDYYPTEREHGYAKSGDDFIRQRDISIEVTGQNIAYVNINITAGVLWLFSNGQPYNGGIAAHPYFKLWTAAGAEVVPDSATVIAGTVSATATSGESLRSGAHVTQEMLLSTSATPADYLLSLCKMLGLYIIADGADKSVRILTRSSFYSGVVLDITDRVDKPSVDIQPLTFDAKWYELRHESVGGRFEQEYLRTSGVQYGIQRIDTGYDFDAQTKDLLSGSVLKSCAAVQARSKFFYNLNADTQKELIAESTTTDAVINGSGAVVSFSGYGYVVKKYDISGCSKVYITGRQGTVPNYAIARFLNSSDTVVSVVQLASQTNYADEPVNVPAGAVFIDITGNGPVGCKADFQIRIPSVFLDPGCNYTLWNADGDSEDFDIVLPGNVTAVPLNADYPGYDSTERAEFRDAENAPVDGADVLLFYRGAPSQVFYQLSDDLPAMDTINGGPCWILGASASAQILPTFSRYVIITSLDLTHRDVYQSLDFGIPREVDIPGLTYTAGTVYLKRWQKYVRDRLSVHGKVMRCRVRLDGMQVGPELLRRFYWYGGSLWSLVSVSNHSLTTFDLTECEFVQVLDITNYTTA